MSTVRRWPVLGFAMLIAAGTGVSALPQDAQTTTAGVEEVRQLNQKGRSADANGDRESS